MKPMKDAIKSKHLHIYVRLIFANVAIAAMAKVPSQIVTGAI
jgi:hypothetical protein